MEWKGVCLNHWEYPLSSQYLLPYLLKLFINKQKDKFQSDYNDEPNASQKENNSQKNVKTKPKEKLGDYVEYEEIQD